MFKFSDLFEFTFILIALIVILQNSTGFANILRTGGGVYTQGVGAFTGAPHFAPGQ